MSVQDKGKAANFLVRSSTAKSNERAQVICRQYVRDYLLETGRTRNAAAKVEAIRAEA